MTQKHRSDEFFCCASSSIVVFGTCLDVSGILRKEHRCDLLKLLVNLRMERRIHFFFVVFIHFPNKNNFYEKYSNSFFFSPEALRFRIIFMTWNFLFEHFGYTLSVYSRIVFSEVSIFENILFKKFVIDGTSIGSPLEDLQMDMADLWYKLHLIFDRNATLVKFSIKNFLIFLKNFQYTSLLPAMLANCDSCDFCVMTMNYPLLLLIHFIYFRL